MTERKVQEAFVRSFTDERLALELRIIQERGHSPQYRSVVMNEASGRLIDLHDKLKGVKAALQEYEEALSARQHGGVAGGKFIDKARELLTEVTTRE